MLYCVTTVNMHKFFFVCLFFCTYRPEFAKKVIQCASTGYSGYTFFSKLHFISLLFTWLLESFLTIGSFFFSPPVVETRRSGSFLFRRFLLPYRDSAWHMITSLSDACLTECLSCCNHYLTHIYCQYREAAIISIFHCSVHLSSQLYVPSNQCTCSSIEGNHKTACR